jgi:hypothetical protein
VIASSVMFLKQYERAGFLDLSSGLRDANGWDVGALRGLHYHLDICALAVEPSSGLLAIGGSGSLGFRSHSSLRYIIRYRQWSYPDIWRPWCGIDDCHPRVHAGQVPSIRGVCLQADLCWCAKFKFISYAPISVVHLCSSRRKKSPPRMGPGSLWATKAADD